MLHKKARGESTYELELSAQKRGGKNYNMRYEVN